MGDKFVFHSKINLFQNETLQLKIVLIKMKLFYITVVITKLEDKVNQILILWLPG